MCKLLVAVVVLGLAGLPTGALALSHPAFRGGHLRIAPASGSRDTVFVVGFNAPERTGVFGGSQRHDLLTASAPSGSAGCITNLALRAPDAPKGHRVRVTLAPRRLGGHWCTGVYRGEIQEIQRAVCTRGRACPAFVVVRGIVGRFVLRVNGAKPGPSPGAGAGNPPPSGDSQPPTFAGLERAFACTPGPQRPGQTSPFTLSWQAAADDQTPTSGIVYDVYYATRSGGEAFATPTWTTPPGATTFLTPGLPSHGAAYFVVRARDRAGNEERNTIEKSGIDSCY